PTPLRASSGPSFAPAPFVLSPLPSRGIAETATSLPACPVSSTATPTPRAAPTPTPMVTTAKLAQTGVAADTRPPLAGLAFLLLGTGVLMRPRRRAPRR